VNGGQLVGSQVQVRASGRVLPLREKRRGFVGVADRHPSDLSRNRLGAGKMFIPIFAYLSEAGPGITFHLATERGPGRRVRRLATAGTHRSKWWTAHRDLQPVLKARCKPPGKMNKHQRCLSKTREAQRRRYGTELT
jgi:hypothetical protein